MNNNNHDLYGRSSVNTRKSKTYEFYVAGCGPRGWHQPLTVDHHGLAIQEVFFTKTTFL